MALEREDRGTWRSWVVVAIAAVVLGVAWLLLRTAAHGVPAWEQTTFERVHELPGWLEQPAEGVMLLGTFWIWLPIAVTLGLVTASWRPAAAAAVAVAAAWLLADVVKDVVARGRPAALLSGVVIRGQAVSGFGFVSGHSTVAFAAATVVAAFVPRAWKPAPFVLATLVAVARVYIGVHFPLDVIGGAALGIVCGQVALAVTGARRRTPSAGHAPSVVR